MTKKKDFRATARRAGRLRIGSAIALAAMLLAGSALGPGQPAHAVEAQSATETLSRGESGLPVPRFVSLKSAKVNARIGPGVSYPVNWLYLKPGLPVEIIQEFDNWRRIRDSDGADGWINQQLLSGKRTAIAAPWQRGKAATLNLLASPSSDARPVAILEPGVIGTIKTCNGDWCEMTFDGHTGWIGQTLVWGAYPGEAVKD